jgi:hypothetical protein
MVNLDGERPGSIKENKLATRSPPPPHEYKQTKLWNVLQSSWIGKHLSFSHRDEVCLLLFGCAFLMSIIPRAMQTL